MNTLTSLLKTLGPRLLGSVFAGVATYVGVKTSGAIHIDPTAAAELVTGIAVSYATAHRIGSAVVNPGDAAKGRLADAEKTASDLGTTVRPAAPGR